MDSTEYALRRAAARRQQGRCSECGEFTHFFSRQSRKRANGDRGAANDAEWHSEEPKPAGRQRPEFAEVLDDEDPLAREGGVDRSARVVDVVRVPEVDANELGFDLLPGGEMRTSVKEDEEAGRPFELDAIAGPILRGRRRTGFATPATEVRLIESR